MCRTDVLTQREVACYLRRFGPSVACKISTVFDASAGHPHLLRFVTDNLLALGIFGGPAPGGTGPARICRPWLRRRLTSGGYLRRLNPFSRRC
jgi:hypothetical protein